ncbi:MAG: hypothetical protein AAGA93_03155 [Actinomycetota bacterium]
MERTSDRPGEAFTITCHNFSDIRRRPLVIGKLDQVRLPFVVTMPQLAVGALTFGLLFLTRPFWGAVMSDRLHIVLFVVLPIVVAQQVSRTSIEGRTVSKAAVGFLRLWLAPRHGEINGQRRSPAASGPLSLQPLLPPEPDPDPLPRAEAPLGPNDQNRVAFDEDGLDADRPTPRGRRHSTRGTTISTSRRTRARLARREAARREVTGNEGRRRARRADTKGPR